jgi:biopolymer transport protein TolQ
MTGIFSLIANSGPVALFVLFVLLFASTISWMIIMVKYRVIRKAVRENNKFLKVFWAGKNIDEILGKTDSYPASPIASVFKSGVKELKKLTGSDVKAAGTEGVGNVSRALSRQSNTEIATLEKHIALLATTASAAPFVGLFGTVWGIMNSFQNIGATGAANLAVVAPGISEALITTAAGIGAAIPAVVAYNYFAGLIKRVAVDMDCFSQDFLNIVQRSVFLGRKGS